MNSNIDCPGVLHFSHFTPSNWSLNVFFQNIIENGGSPENRWIYSANSCRNWITSLGNGFDNTTMNSIEASKLIISKQLNRDGVKGDICSNDRLLGKQICVQLHVGTKSRCLFSGMCIYHVYWYLNMQTEHYTALITLLAPSNNEEFYLLYSALSTSDRFQ